MRTRIRLLTRLGFLSALAVLGQGPASADELPSKGVTPYMTHFVFRPVQSLDIAGLGKAVLLEAVGTTENMKGEKMLDKMSARCNALSVDSGRNISTAHVFWPTPTAI